MLKIPKQPNLTELAYLNVKQYILDGSISEGAKLTEESLASQLGISKSPVREALNRLESDGLVVIESRRGAFVRSFSAREARDLFDLRELLEVHAVGIAHVTDSLLREMDESIDRTKQHLADGNLVAHVEEDIRFHTMIAAATKNDELCKVLANVHQKSFLCRSRTYRISGGTAPASHGSIRSALERGDREQAQAAMREHLRYVRNALLQSMAGQEDQNEPAAGIALKQS